jgi:PAS domain S-box-containing protein
MRVRTTIVLSTVLVALFDIWTPASLVGCTLYTLPLVFCAVQRSKALLWGTAIAASVLTVVAGIWGVERSATITVADALLNRGLVMASLITLTVFIHLWIERRSISDAVAEAKRMEKHFRRLLELAPDAMVIASANGVIQLVNQQAEHIFGYSKQEMEGQRVEMLIPAHLAGRHEEHRAQYMKDPKFRMMGQGMELQGRRKDGSEFPVEIALSH